MAWGMGKRRGTEEQGLEASPCPKPHTRPLNVTVPEHEFRMTTIGRVACM
jgi:hypothetical protein